MFSGWHYYGHGVEFNLLYSPFSPPLSPTPGPTTFTFNLHSWDLSNALGSISLSDTHSPMIFLKYILYHRSLAYIFCNLQMSHIPKNYKWFDNDLALLSFLFDCLSFILWKGWNWQDWWWSHWTKHKGNCSIFHFLNKTKNIYFYLFTTKSLSEKETKNDKTNIIFINTCHGHRHCRYHHLHQYHLAWCSCPLPLYHGRSLPTSESKSRLMVSSQHLR